MSIPGAAPKWVSSPKAGATVRGSVKISPAGGLHKPSAPRAWLPPGAPSSLPSPKALNKSLHPARIASTENVALKIGPGAASAPTQGWSVRSKSPAFVSGLARPVAQRQSCTTVGISAIGAMPASRPFALPASCTSPKAGKLPFSTGRKEDAIQRRASWYWRAASVGLLGIPYLFDYYQSHLAQVYENTHGGYHSVERHDAWYRPANMYRRTQKHPKKKKLSQMINWKGGNVPHYKISSQFATDNWQLYSVGQGEDHLRKLDKKAVIDQNQAKPWVKGHDFTIKYTGWTTGWSYDAKHKDGEACEYIYYAYSKDPANPTHYFLGQHFPKTGPAANNFTVSTWRLI